VLASALPLPRELALPPAELALNRPSNRTRGTPADSGTGQLAGLSGTTTITLVDKKHLYEFGYSLSAR